MFNQSLWAPVTRYNNKSCTYGHLVMNRHFYGFPKGLPLESFVCLAIGFNLENRLLWDR
ncbi:hypothetical protein J3F84DRAFT_389615 [Trichoderma pleuroticola]